MTNVYAHHIRFSAFLACGLRNSRAKISQSLRGTGIAPVAFFAQVT